MATKTYVTDHKMQEIKHLLCTRFDDVLLSFTAKEETWKLRSSEPDCGEWVGNLNDTNDTGY